MSAGKKILAGGISAILLVGVVIGVIAGVMSSNNRSIGDDFSMPNTASGVNSVSKSIEGLCKSTDYQEACLRTLRSGVSGNNTNNPKEVVKAAIKATIEEVKAAYEKSKNVGDGTQDGKQKAALADCQTLLQDAVDELQDALHANTNDPKEMARASDDLKVWLSAVISYQATCVDGLDHPELKTAMEKGLTNATQLTDNALAIVNELSKLMSGIQKAMEAARGGPSRRLLSNTNKGYPEWFNAADRRLLRGSNRGNVKPNVVVAKDGSGNFKTISAALAAMPKDKNRKTRYVIYVKAGVYNENVMVDKDMVNVFMYGDGPKRTIVTGKKNFVDGTPTFQTATFAAVGERFVAKSMGFTNTAGPEKHQAVALRVQSDMSAFFNCRMDAFQDTLYVQTHRQFYRNCVISGTVDFIFGDAAAVIQNCLIIVRKPMDNQQNIVTAQGRKSRQEVTGIVIHNCRIVPDKQLFPVRFKIRSYLGRPWKEYSRTIFMESTLGDFIQPEGYLPWEGDFALKTLFYAEYGNRGPGARITKRVKWPGYKGIISRSQALQFTAEKFINGNMWIKFTGAPYLPSLKR